MRLTSGGTEIDSSRSRPRPAEPPPAAGPPIPAPPERRPVATGPPPAGRRPPPRATLARAPAPLFAAPGADPRPAPAGGGGTISSARQGPRVTLTSTSV